MSSKCHPKYFSIGKALFYNREFSILKLLSWNKNALIQYLFRYKENRFAIVLNNFQVSTSKYYWTVNTSLKEFKNKRHFSIQPNEIYEIVLDNGNDGAPQFASEKLKISYTIRFSRVGLARFPNVNCFEAVYLNKGNL